MKTKQKAKIGNQFVNQRTVVSKTTKKAVGKSTKSTNPLLKALKEEDNYTLTQNGALTYKSTLNAVLDLFAMGGALRSRSESDVIQLFTKAFVEDPLLTLKCVFNIRNCRGGAGERKTFRTILKYLGNNYPDIVIKNLASVGIFGRLDDLYCLFDTKSEKNTLDFLKALIDQDVESYEKDESISLAAKWLPSENTSSAATCALARKIRNHFGWTPKQYRKTLSTLRSYSNVVEVKMSANEWTNINYSAVPSRAALIYKDAFKKRDGARYQQFLDSVKRGEAKINSATLFPYEIVKKVRSGESSETLDALWNALPNYLEGNERNILCVCDVSGSMDGMAGMPMNSSIALGIYTAEHNKGPFAGYFITYSDDPKLQKVTGNTITEKVRNLQRHCAYSTNLQSVFDMLLKTAKENKVKQSDMPEQILVLTDCELNANQNGSVCLVATQKKYKAAGYECPQLVFWNLNSMQNNVMAKADNKGVLLISGQSPSVFKTLLSGKQHTPVDQMLETLNQSCYDRVVI
jgi:hypothetical protein